MRFKAVFFLMLMPRYLLSGISFENLISKRLLGEKKYQKYIAGIQQEEARQDLDQSTLYPELNFSCQSISNDVERDEYKTFSRELEVSTIEESDERLSVSLQQEFFAMDFDYAQDALQSYSDLFCVSEQMDMVEVKLAGDLIKEQIDFFEAEQMLGLKLRNLEQLKYENMGLKSLYDENIISADQLIKNIKELEDTEKDISNYQIVLNSFKDHEFGEVFSVAFNEYMTEMPNADTLGFIKRINEAENQVSRCYSRSTKRLNRYRISSWFPELNLSASLNWRDTDQYWEIQSEDELEIWDRDQNETYSLFQIEFSIPLNFYQNLKGRNQLLKGYEKEYSAERNYLMSDLLQLETERLELLSLRARELERKELLVKLYRDNLQTAERISEMSVKEASIEREKAEIKLQEAIIRCKVAEMKYYREIFLINEFGEIVK